MIERVVIPPYDEYDLSTFAIKNGIVQFGHFGGYVNEQGEVLETFEEQFAQTLKNLEQALAKIELGLNNVLKLNVLLRDIEDFHKMHEIWKKHFNEGSYPVRAVITSDFVEDDILVQVEGKAAY